jgi:amino acid transporter
VLLFGVAFGYFANIVAFTNWGTRTVFTLAREGLLPKYFATVARETETPARAIVGLAALAFLYIVGLVIVSRATLTVWGYMATAGALMYAAAYLLAMLALGAYGWRTLRNALMLIAAVIGVPTFGYVIYSAVHPEPAYPLDLWTWVGVGVSAAACLIALAVRWARVPAGRTFGLTVEADTRLAMLDEAPPSPQA